MSSLSNTTRRKHKDSFGLLIRGFCIGIADIIPGVSGGTMAFILGIYSRFINAIKSFDAVWFKSILGLDFKIMVERPDFDFVIPIIAGVFGALLFFTHVIPIPELLNSHGQYLYGFFFGLVLSSIVTFFTSLGKLRLNDICAIGLGLTFGLVLINASPDQPPEVWWFTSLCGVAAICAMLLPGISGAFVLVILGQYDEILYALGNFEWRTIGYFSMGVSLGLFAFSRIIAFLMEHFNRMVFCAMCGLLVGSLWVLWPFQHRNSINLEESTVGAANLFIPEPTSAAMYTFFLAAVGFSLNIIIHYLAKKKRKLLVTKKSSNVKSNYCD